ncbi:hypothetical protein [Desulfovibrio gilichinskyi]|uniref:Uncharacterized protein n=1 Tax=Desulfovibrio gilichinskyi TaxID=1519643 RepID=A0A1X7EHB3_9BACT|nr:hypothetical protein [Desulfovibrio gilichinskyi]SMF33903.1 hypothetical protein SAMN06295933_2938 [Desulfovibrio gilichinskyi]
MQLTNATKANAVLVTAPWTFDASLRSVPGLISLGSNNATNSTYYFVSANDANILVGITNGTVNGTAPVTTQRGQSGNGTSIAVMYTPGDFDAASATKTTPDIYNTTWDYYAYGVDSATSKPAIAIAQVKFGASTATTAQVKYYDEIDSTTGTQPAATWTDFTVTNTGNYLNLRNGNVFLLQNATVNNDNNLITGTIFDYVDGDKLFVVMIKSGTTLATTDLTNRGFKFVYTGSLGSTGNVGSATAGLMNFSIDNNLDIDGNMARFNGTTFTKVGTSSANFEDLSLSGYRVALANTNQFGITQSNMTMYDIDNNVSGSFIGKQAADKSLSVGIYMPVVSSVDQGASLAFLIPNPAVAGDILRANLSFQANASLDQNITARVVDLSATNNTSYTKTELSARWSGVPAEFTPLTDVKGVRAKLPTIVAKNSLYTFQFPVKGICDRISNLRLLEVPTTASSSARAFSYAGSAPTPSVEGSWWISEERGDSYKGLDSVLSPATAQTYYVNYVVRDNGVFDSNATGDRYISDPVVFGSVPTSSSSSSSGCVFNPAASFGLEWLLLMLAPMVAIARSRFKK